MLKVLENAAKSQTHIGQFAEIWKHSETVSENMWKNWNIGEIIENIQKINESFGKCHIIGNFFETNVTCKKNK